MRQGSESSITINDWVSMYLRGNIIQGASAIISTGCHCGIMVFDSSVEMEDGAFLGLLNEGIIMY